MLRVAARRQRLNRLREPTEHSLERALGARFAVDLLQPSVQLRPQAGIGGAGTLDPQLALQVNIELTVDAGDPDAGAELAERDGDLVR